MKFQLNKQYILDNPIVPTDYIIDDEKLTFTVKGTDKRSVFYFNKFYEVHHASRDGEKYHFMSENGVDNRDICWFFREELLNEKDVHDKEFVNKMDDVLK